MWRSSTERRCELIDLSHPEPRLFAISQWPVIPQLVYLIYRVLVALFFITWIILSGVIKYSWYSLESDRVKWFIYLTNWSFTLLTITTILQTACVIYDYCAYERQRPPKRAYLKQKAEMPSLFKTTWVFTNVSSVAALLVTLLFWSFVYPTYHACTFPEILNHCGLKCTRTCSDPEPICTNTCVKRCECPADTPVWHNGTCIDAAECFHAVQHNITLQYQHTQIWDLHVISIMTHAGNSIYVMLNLCITAMPIKMLHFLHFAVFAFVYTSFSALYYVFGGTNAHHKHYIYNVLDWEYPTITLAYCIGCFIGGAIMWCTICLLTEFRCYLQRNLCKRSRWKRTRGQSLAVIVRNSESSFTDEASCPMTAENGQS